jgi:hypothetical protein
LVADLVYQFDLWLAMQRQKVVPGIACIFGILLNCMKYIIVHVLGLIIIKPWLQARPVINLMLAPA